MPTSYIKTDSVTVNRRAGNALEHLREVGATKRCRQLIEATDTPTAFPMEVCLEDWLLIGRTEPSFAGWADPIYPEF